MRNELRDAAIVEVRSRIVDACLKQARLPEGMPLDVLINDTLYHEKQRLERDRQSPTRDEDLAFWEGVRSRLGKAGESEQKEILVRVVERFTEEVRGNFTPWVYDMATRFIPRALPGMMADPDQARADRVMAAVLPMKKPDIAALEAAYAG